MTARVFFETVYDPIGLRIHVQRDRGKQLEVLASKGTEWKEANHDEAHGLNPALVVPDFDGEIAAALRISMVDYLGRTSGDPTAEAKLLRELLKIEQARVDTLIAQIAALAKDS